MNSCQNMGISALVWPQCTTRDLSCYLDHQNMTLPKSTPPAPTALEFSVSNPIVIEISRCEDLFTAEKVLDLFRARPHSPTQCCSQGVALEITARRRRNFFSPWTFQTHFVTKTSSLRSPKKLILSIGNAFPMKRSYRCCPR